jgi:Flp pilus assembly protein CpaB
MRSRGLVVAIAVVLAIVAAAGVVLYTNGVKNDAVTGGQLSVVVVATQPIPANTNLDPLIEQGAFSDLQVPTAAVVDGAITNVSQLRGQTTTSPILQNEQIAAERLSSGELPDGGALGISDGNVAVSMRVSDEAAVNGSISRGSYITIYATFDSPELVPGANAAQQVQQAANGAGAQQTAKLPTITVTLIPAVRVLEVVNPVVASEDGSSSSSSNNGQVTLTLDLTPEDAQNLVYAQETGSTWIGLLPPQDTDGHSIPFSVIPLNRVLGKDAV